MVESRGTTVSTDVRPDFRFLDGARALAAIVVALLHASLFTGRLADHSDLPRILKPLELGQFAVPVFIVLSGFVLMLPVARRPDLDLPGGALSFIKRRARRLLPPYYASLVIFMVLIAVTPVLQERGGTAWDSKIPVTDGGVVSHLFVVHNLSGQWRYQINGPAWSVATEWQIYLAMVVVLLPLWRRGGPLLALAAALLLTWGVHFRWPAFDGAHLWYVGDFTLGMLAAVLVVGRRSLPGLGACTAVGGTACVVIGLIAPNWVNDQKWLTEVVFGAVVAAGITWMAHRTQLARPTPFHRVLESRPLVGLGQWSYSFYLIHSPLLALANLLLIGMPMPMAVRFGVMALLALPLAGAIAYAFHRLVERRFMTGHQRGRRPAPTVG